MGRRPNLGNRAVNRIVVSDDGSRLWLTVYAQDRSEPLAVVELIPQQALHLINELVSATIRHLDRRMGVIR